MHLVTPMLTLLEIQIPYDPYNNPLNNTEWAFPLLEIIHIIGFAVAIGTIFMQDLRLMGVGMRHQLPSELRKDLIPGFLMPYTCCRKIFVTSALRTSFP
jgi:hypothetical protein